MTTEIETVTVDFEEFKANVFDYVRVIETKRVVVMREGEEVAVGLRLPGEERIMTPQRIAFYRNLLPSQPIDRENTLSRALEESREDRTFT
jgi:hypothetical protein